VRRELERLVELVEARERPSLVADLDRAVGLSLGEREPVDQRIAVCRVDVERRRGRRDGLRLRLRLRLRR
jgi:hypothetical protein